MSLVTNDPAEFELTLRPWELQCCPRTGGDFTHSMSSVKTAAFTIYRERFSLPVDVQGISPGKTLVMGAPIYFGRQARYWGAPYAGSTLPSLLPGPLDVKFDAGHHHQVVIVDLSYLEASLPEEAFDHLVCAIQSHLPTAPPRILKNYMDWGGRLLTTAANDPSLIEQAPIVETLQQELLQHLSLIAGGAKGRSGGASYSARRRGLLNVLDYLRGDAKTVFSMADICRIAGISERSLQYAFQETFGMTPFQFMKRRRLHAVRQALIDSDYENNVSQVATEFGFYELGRFAAEYRRLFGELPSVTRTLAN